jgi:hypothetical protein
MPLTVQNFEILIADTDRTTVSFGPFPEKSRLYGLTLDAATSATLWTFQVASFASRSTSLLEADVLTPVCRHFPRVSGLPDTVEIPLRYVLTRSLRFILVEFTVTLDDLRGWVALDIQTPS